MATKKAKAATAETMEVSNPVLSVEVPAGANARECAARYAQKLTRPEVLAAGVIEQWQKDTHDINALVRELGQQVDTVNGGDLRRAEGMLIAQAHTLDCIFANLARRAMNQEYLRQWEAYMRMAMKAQAQCRMTLETLAAIKNPPVVFARQANINNGGQQQVNNGGPAMPDAANSTRAREGAEQGFQRGFQIPAHARGGGAAENLAVPAPATAPDATGGPFPQPAKC